MAQSIERPTSAQVMISWFVGLSPTLGSTLTAQSLPEDSVPPSLSLPLPHVPSVSAPQKQINIKKSFLIIIFSSNCKKKRYTITTDLENIDEHREQNKSLAFTKKKTDGQGEGEKCPFLHFSSDCLQRTYYVQALCWGRGHLWE